MAYRVIGEQRASFSRRIVAVAFCLRLYKVFVYTTDFCPRQYIRGDTKVSKPFLFLSHFWRTQRRCTTPRRMTHDHDGTAQPQTAKTRYKK